MKRKCAICRCTAVRITPAGKGWCGGEDCGAKLALALLEKQRAKRERQDKKQAKEERAATRKAKEGAKSRSRLAAEAQEAVNAYVRARDAGKPCISCGRPDDGTHQRHAGHWKTVKARKDIRFDPANIHAQCSQDNQYGGGGLHPGYFPELLRRIGQDEVDRLERVTIRRYTDDDYREIRDRFRAMKREIERGR